MKRSIDSHTVRSILHHASEMLRELRTNLLSPKNYYSLYIQVMDELQTLTTYLQETNTLNLQDIYAEVQACGNVLPRLYVYLYLIKCIQITSILYLM